MPIKQNKYPSHQSPLYQLRNRKKLAALLGISTADLRKLSRSDTLYTEFDISKKNGGMRHVENPRRPLKLVQARISRLLNRIHPPDYLFCPVKGRSYVTNAAAHRHNRVVSCLDVKKYFPNTPSKRVYWFFHTVMRCESDIAALLTKLATYQAHLPTGSPLSPILAHYAYYDMWQKVAAIAKANGFTLTVYIDDVTISGRKVATRAVWDIKQAIHRAGLRYHKEKRYIDVPAEITGVIIRDGQVYAPNRQFKKLHDEKRNLTNSNHLADKKMTAGRIKGLAGQLEQIRILNSVQVTI